MRDYLLSAAAVIALMASGAAAPDRPVVLIDGLGDHHHTIATAQKAVSKLAYNEQADWRESLGAALLKSGRAADAEAVFRADLQKNPRSGRLLFGLMQALAAQGKADEAMLVRQEFDEAWRTARIEPDPGTL